MAEILAYVHKDGLFHRLHPVTKIVFVIGISIICIISTSLLFLAALVLALLTIAYVSNLYDEIILQSKLVVMMSIVFIVITLLTVPTGDIFGYLIPQGFPLFGGSIALTGERLRSVSS